MCTHVLGCSCAHMWRLTSYSRQTNRVVYNYQSHSSTMRVESSGQTPIVKTHGNYLP